MLRLQRRGGAESPPPVWESGVVIEPYHISDTIAQIYPISSR